MEIHEFNPWKQLYDETRRGINRALENLARAEAEHETARLMAAHWENRSKIEADSATGQGEWFPPPTSGW
jgi:hypothetical protein